MPTTSIQTNQKNRFQAPPAGSFGRVLRRTDRDVKLLAGQTTFTGYNVRVCARGITHPDGIEALTLFFPKDKDAAAHRAGNFGWHDVTSMWSDKQTARPESIAEMAAMKWPAILALAEENGVTASGKKRPKVIADLAAKFGIDTE